LLKVYDKFVTTLNTKHLSEYDAFEMSLSYHCDNNIEKFFL